MLEIKFKNADEVKSYVGKARQAVEEEVREEIKKCASDVQNTLYANTPAGERIPHLRTRAFTKGGEDAVFEIQGYEAKIGASGKAQEILGYLEYGTPRSNPGGLIYPKRAKALHFFVKGEEVFTKWVKGIKPHGIFLRTRQIWQTQFSQRMNVAVKRGMAR